VKKRLGVILRFPHLGFAFPLPIVSILAFPSPQAIAVSQLIRVEKFRAKQMNEVSAGIAPASVATAGELL